MAKSKKLPPKKQPRSVRLREDAAKMGKKLSAVIVEDLPQEARDVYFSKSGAREWELRPDSVEGGQEYVYFCEGCNRFHKEWYVPGWRVTCSDSGAHVFQVAWTVDADGEWESDECDVDELGYDPFERSYSYEELAKSWAPYYEHVCDTGDDYLETFFAKDPEEKKQAAKKALRDLAKELG